MVVPNKRIRSRGDTEIAEGEVNAAILRAPASPYPTQRSLRGDADPRELSSSPVPVSSVYVHAPFCSRQCRYCDFAIHITRSAPVADWLAAIAAEWRALESEGRAVVAARLNTLYVGGGTPSLLGPTAMHGLREIVGGDRLSGADLEWSAEANPESFTAAVARGWRKAGVTRLSLGIQSFHAPALRWMARRHGPSETEQAVRAARAVGLENISVDLIFGLPAHLGRSWSQDLDRALSLEPVHISLYGLTVEPGTPLQRAIDAGRETQVDEALYRDEYLHAAERLSAEGYRHYEVSNFARPGYESRHNRSYWSGSAYLGLGNGAHSYVPPLRRWNLRDWIAYRDLAVRGDLPLCGEERIEGATLRLERIWLGLRTADGLSETTLAALGGRLEAFREKAAQWIRAGWALPHATVRCVGTPGTSTPRNVRSVGTPESVREDADRLRLSAEGWLLLDQLAVELDTSVAVA